jgi:hypothetical protein
MLVRYGCNSPPPVGDESIPPSKISWPAKTPYSELSTTPNERHWRLCSAASSLLLMPKPTRCGVHSAAPAGFDPLGLARRARYVGVAP